MHHALHGTSRYPHTHPWGLSLGSFVQEPTQRAGGRKPILPPAACTLSCGVGWAARGPRGHSPANALLGIVQQDTHDVQEAREQLQGEVEEPDPQACGGGSRDGAAFLGIPSSPWTPETPGYPVHPHIRSPLMPQGAAGAPGQQHCPRFAQGSCPVPQTQESSTEIKNAGSAPC